jgi:FkbM family methyltransferase
MNALNDLTMLERIRAKLLQFTGCTWQTLNDAVKRDLELIPPLIGQSGAARALAYYLYNYNQLMDDHKLADFMQFYAKSHTTSHSQWSQDIWVMYESQGRGSGCYLEIGGADGFTHSNTSALEIYYGWSGTLVEPEQHQYRILQISRKGNRLINKALSPRGKIETTTLRSVGQLSTLRGYESNDIHYDHRMLSRSFQRVQAIPLETILADTKYDYFSFDIEGAELNVLESVNWNQIFKPRLLTIEHNARENEKDRLLNLFTEIGYVPCFSEHTWLLQGDIWLKLE